MSSIIYQDIKTIVKEVVNAQNPADCVVGTVVNLTPLQILIDDNTDYDPERVYIIPKELKKYTVNTEFNGNMSIDGALKPCLFSGALTIDNSLKVGDSVLLLKCQSGQSKVILGRV